MALAFDGRKFLLEIKVGEEVIASYDEKFYMVASGTRYSNGNFGECALRIDNISKTTRDYLISKTTPWAKDRQNAIISLNVGRESYGTFQLFTGNMIAGSITQPPDIGIIFHSSTGAAALGQVNAFSANPKTSFQAICQQVADNISAAWGSPVTLSFQSKFGSKIIGNYTFTGGITDQVHLLAQLADVDAYIENNTLVIRDIGVPRKDAPIEINVNTGMIGIPEITEIGLRVRVLITNNILLGSPVRVTSAQNAVANGLFYVVRQYFEVASREAPFYWILDLTPNNLALGYTQ